MFTAVLSEAANRALERTRFSDVRCVDETGSTNADLMALARAGAGDGTVLVADHQTAGRGRADRTWIAPPGSSLLVSVLLRATPAFAPLAGMAVGVAAVDAVSATTGVGLRLKWPNDLVWPGLGDGTDRKAGGILAEADWSDADAPAVVVGLGLNVNWPRVFPDELLTTATSLNHVAGRDIDREAVLVAILRELDRGWGDPRVVDAVRERSATLRTRVRVHLAAEQIEGVAAELTEDGHLVLETDDGQRHTITAGDVVHLRPT
jgi:BirA family transcriptional regulator, biotin operon repressor / biotin---[acetyl-CoA-carboxylase] ligase